jgi:hypothetical protein
MMWGVQMILLFNVVSPWMNTYAHSHFFGQLIGKRTGWAMMKMNITKSDSMAF